MLPWRNAIGRLLRLIVFVCASSAPSLGVATVAMAQPAFLHFEQVTNRIPYRVWTDRQGFVWIRYHGEAFLFDGVEFAPLDRFWPELLRLPPNRIPFNSLVDSEGATWLAIEDDLSRSSGRFGSLESMDLDLDGPGLTYFRAFLLDQRGRVWIASSKGLVLYDPSTSTFKCYTHDPSDPGSISSSNVESLAQDSSGTIWAGTINGLNRLTDEQTGRFNRYRYNPGPLVDTGDGYSNASLFPLLYVDQDGALWAVAFWPTGAYWTHYSFEGDLLRYDPVADSLRAYSSDLDAKVTGFAQDRSGRYWIGTKDGLLTFTSDTARPKRVDLHSIKGRRLRLGRGSILIDQQDILWITTDEGLAKADLHQQPFEYYGHDPLEPNSLTPNWIRALRMNEDGTVWIGTDYPDKGQEEGGLSLLNRSTGRLTHFRKDPADPGTLSSNEITAIEHAADGKVWVATAEGLSLVDPTSGKVTRYYLGGDALSMQPVKNPAFDTYVASITPTEGGDLWLGVGGRGRYDSGVVRVAPNLSTLTYYPVEGDNRSLVSRRGSLWIAGVSGISRFDNETDRWDKLVETNSIWQNVRGIASMHVDGRGDIWIATQGSGLWRFDPDQEILKGFRLGDNRSSQWISCILEDDYGLLWASSLDGLFRFDPVDGTVDRFSAADGLQANQFASQGCDRSDSGELAFGGVNGLNVFRPVRDVTNPYPPKVFVTSITVGEERLSPGIDPRLPESIEQTQSMTLSPQDRNVSFEYTGIHFSDAGNLQFEYRLDGFDSDWQQAGTRRIANYTNLDPGEYAFRVRVFNGRFQSDRETIVRFVILTPWWARWWAFAVYVLLFGGVLYAGYSFRVRRLKARSLMLENLVAERTRELEVQAERLVELDQSKNRFFANISHEFRTPMTLILGPLQDLVDGVHGKVSRRVREQLGTMRHSAERMLNLITQLLDLTKMDAGQLEIRRSDVNLIAHLEALVTSFVPMAEREGVRLEFVREEAELKIYSDPDMLDKVVGNLVSNAIKFTPEDGNVWVTTRLPEGDSPAYLEIMVSDTGPGIPQKEVARIFDRFATFDPQSSHETTWTRTHEGIGIGLALAKEMVELHKGTIFVESIPGFGSTFTVRLPFEPVASSVTVTEASVETESSIPGMQDNGEAEEVAETATILVVEDNADVRAYIRTHLSEGYRIVEAANGRDALKAAKTEHPDLILTDVMMPVMDGYVFCRAIKSDERLRNTPVVMLTAKAGEESTLEGLETGADEYIEKPFSVPELKARIANLIEAHRQMRRQFSREVVVQPAGITIASEDETFLNQALELIETHLGDSNFGVDWLADEMGMSARHLTRRVEAVTGESPAALIRRLRLERASQLLSVRAGTVSEVAYQVGFKSVSHFSSAFKGRYGVRPSEWSDNGG